MLRRWMPIHLYETKIFAIQFQHPNISIKFHLHQKKSKFFDHCQSQKNWRSMSKLKSKSQNWWQKLTMMWVKIKDSKTQNIYRKRIDRKHTATLKRLSTSVALAAKLYSTSNGFRCRPEMHFDFTMLTGDWNLPWEQAEYSGLRFPHFCGPKGPK